MQRMVNLFSSKYFTAVSLAIATSVGFSMVAKPASAISVTNGGAAVSGSTLIDFESFPVGSFAGFDGVMLLVPQTAAQ